MSSAQLAEFVRRAPKVELHVHLEGSVGPELLLELAGRHGLSLPGAERGVQGLRERYVFSSFRDFIELYLLISAALQTAQDFSDAVAHVAAKLSAQGVVYCELTFTPMTHVAQGIDPEVVVAGIEEGAQRALVEHGVEIGWVFDIVRTLPDQAAQTLAMALRTKGVVGLGFAGMERDGQAFEPFAPHFDRARAAGLASLPHAGEHAGPQSIWQAVNVLGARRIGHGVRCLEDDSLVATLVERGIPLEVCPSSNVALGIYPQLADHVLPRLLDAGLKLSINSDDPPLFNTTLIDEYRRCIETFNWGYPRVRSLLRDAVDHSLLGDERRQEIKRNQAALAASLGLDDESSDPSEDLGAKR